MGDGPLVFAQAQQAADMGEKGEGGRQLSDIWPRDICVRALIPDAHLAALNRMSLFIQVSLVQPAKYFHIDCRPWLWFMMLEKGAHIGQSWLCLPTGPSSDRWSRAHSLALHKGPVRYIPFV